ncbi:hypothetical protein DFJ74DRAFT_700816 [Hyaloraphidium curvatum]|nr:hypothetical protein DFJ74DRAFT_700816 [Hyaloraphidium curvatum]
MPAPNGRSAPRSAELDAMDELTASLAALQEIQASLAHLDIDPEDENFDWNKLNLQSDIASILKVMDQASGALDEVERRTDTLNAKLDEMLREGEEAARRLESAKKEAAEAEGKPAEGPAGQGQDGAASQSAPSEDAAEKSD